MKSKPSLDTVTIPKAEYKRLREIAREAEEDAGTSRLVGRAKKQIDGGLPLFPKETVDRLARGENPIRTLREHREVTQQELAVAVGITQGYLSDLENGKRKGPLALHSNLARYLKVPLELLVTIAVSEKESDPERYRKRKNYIQSRQRNRA